MKELRAAISANDVVVLMKIGQRLPQVMALLRELGIASQCAFGHRIGLPDEVICANVEQLNVEKSLGYLSTMLIRARLRISRKEARI
jgi:precorrin-2/cobalt-factor-2 C20-methyltransferase